MLLENGISMEVKSCVPSQSSSSKEKKPTLLFLHGSFHSAWCWTEHFFPYFCSKGYPVVAISWRGTGGTFAGEGVKKVKINEHAQDLKLVLEKLPSLKGLAGGSSVTKPVAISHSFGGLAVMKVLENNPEVASKLSGIVTMCSVPPSGNGPMTKRYLMRSLIASWRITAGFAMKRCITNASLCRTLFFGGDKQVREDGTVDDFGVSDDDIARYQQYFQRDTEATIDLLDLVKNLPSAKAIDGKAPFVDRFPPCLVIGAKDDYIVDVEGVEETARYFGLDAPTFVDSPHDVMLGRKWQNAADALDTWISDTL